MRAAPSTSSSAPPTCPPSRACQSGCAPASGGGGSAGGTWLPSALSRLTAAVSPLSPWLPPHSPHSAARLDCVSLANNHCLDFKQAGLEETQRTLRAAGIAFAGVGAADAAAAPALLERGGLRVAVLSYAGARWGGRTAAALQLLPADVSAPRRAQPTLPSSVFHPAQTTFRSGEQPPPGPASTT